MHRTMTIRLIGTEEQITNNRMRDVVRQVADRDGKASDEYTLDDGARVYFECSDILAEPEAGAAPK